MKADRELYSRFEDIHFEYERITSINVRGPQK